MADPHRKPAQQLSRALREFRMLDDLDDDALAGLASRCRIARFGSGEQVIRHRDCGDDIYLVLEGRLWATVYSASGREVAYEELHRGSMFGEIAAVDMGPRTAHVIAIEPTVAAVLPGVEFRHLLSAHPALALATLRRLASMVRSLTDRVYEFSALPVRGRLLAELLRLAREGRNDGGRVTITGFPTHSQLAGRISTHREAVSRELAELARRKLLRQTGRTLVIDDLGALGRCLGELERGAR